MQLTDPLSSSTVSNALSNNVTRRYSTILRCHCDSGQESSKYRPLYGVSSVQVVLIFKRLKPATAPPRPRTLVRWKLSHMDCFPLGGKWDTSASLSIKGSLDRGPWRSQHYLYLYTRRGGNTPASTQPLTFAEAAARRFGGLGPRGHMPSYSLVEAKHTRLRYFGGSSWCASGVQLSGVSISSPAAHEGA